ncbi:hypothetical protein [Sphingobium sp. WCS2017Hpa-17]|uniref:hypothetical protein n=1 Tax=Sphingobium sp. WCS2017Hpa-17 TaxID=3073638 RepID=UPI0028894B39|nr:hypothetical protein [Sphingobium sp. WCS2017Hpa-17]
MRTLLAIFAAALAQPVAAQTIAIPFAPPIDRALTYRIEQHRPVAGKVSAFTATRELRFERAGEGYALTVTLRAIDTDAAASGAQPYRSALGPLVGIPMRFRLDGQGKVVALDDEDAIWTKVRAGVDAVAAEPGSERQQAAQKVRALFDGLSVEGRLSLLSGELRPLFLFAGSDVAGGAGRGLRSVAGSPLVRPVPVEGTLMLASQNGDMLDLDEKLAGDGVQVSIKYRLSRATGLVESQERSLIAGGQPLVESRTLTPAE